MRLDGSVAYTAYSGGTTGDKFIEYLKETLIPTLKPWDIVIMDNLHAHQSSKVVELIQARQAEVRFLPPYSPDLNPIEKMWSKVKEFLRALQVRTENALFEAIGAALCHVTADDAQGWFHSCGYTAKHEKCATI